MDTYPMLEANVLEWARARGILDNSDPKTQCLKFVSEAGELADAVASRNKTETVDAIGDVMVTLIILAKLEHLDVRRCLESAFDVISRRTGKMVEGIFVKDVL